MLELSCVVFAFATSALCKLSMLSREVAKGVLCNAIFRLPFTPIIMVWPYCDGGSEFSLNYVIKFLP